MERFEVNILGCGSAIPTVRHTHAAQVLVARESEYMIDCGEGTQRQLRHARLSFSRLRHIFISHLHGDHCFGLMGLFNTIALLGNTAEIHVYSPAGLERLLAPQLDFYVKSHGDTAFDVVFHEVDCETSQTIFEDKAVSVRTLPLDHRIPCVGYLFTEHPSLPHIRRDMVDYYHIPDYALRAIKEGAGWEMPDGTFIPHTRLTMPTAPPRSYAYCSDTAWKEDLVALVRGATLLYHEATFVQADAVRARQTFHSTAAEAATVAREAGVKRLMIGHYSARYNDLQPLLCEAQAVFPNTFLADEGLRVSID